MQTFLDSNGLVQVVQAVKDKLDTKATKQQLKAISDVVNLNNQTITTRLDAADATLDKRIDNINTRIDNVIVGQVTIDGNMFNDVLNQAKIEIYAKTESDDAVLNSKIDETESNILSAVTLIQSQLQTGLQSTSATLQQGIDDAVSYTDTQISKTSKAISSTIVNTSSSLNSKIDQTIADLETEKVKIANAATAVDLQTEIAVRSSTDADLLQKIKSLTSVVDTKETLDGNSVRFEEHVINQDNTYVKDQTIKLNSKKTLTGIDSNNTLKDIITFKHDVVSLGDSSGQTNINTKQKLLVNNTERVITDANIVDVVKSSDQSLSIVPKTTDNGTILDITVDRLDLSEVIQSIKNVENKIPVVPTKVSEFENDSGFLTSQSDFLKTKADVNSVYSKQDTDKAIDTAIKNIVNNAPESYDTLKEIADWITTDGAKASEVVSKVATLQAQVEQNKTAIESKQDAIANFETLKAGALLGSTAIQPDILAEKLDQYVSAEKIEEVKQLIPTIPTKISVFENDVGYIDRTELNQSLDTKADKTKVVTINDDLKYMNEMLVTFVNNF